MSLLHTLLFVWCLLFLCHQRAYCYCNVKRLCKPSCHLVSGQIFLERCVDYATGNVLMGQPSQAVVNESAITNVVRVVPRGWPVGMWQKLWACLYFMLVRPFVKWCLRQFTGQCELQRLCYQCEYGAPRTKAVEYSLQHSRSSVIKNLMTTNDLDVDYATEIIMKQKRIKQPKFSILFKECLIQISGYKSLITDIEDMRKISYDSEDTEHEILLMKVWNNLQPDNPLDGRITKKWGDIGFQGDDPKTDFRGMGLLGLHNLVYFVSQYTLLARQALSHSHHPQYGYSFAIVGINLTSMAYHLLLKDRLKTHFYNHVAGKPQLFHFHQVYCYLFFEFDRFWMSEKPESIMAFSRLRDHFEEGIIKLLQDNQTILKIKAQ